MKTGPKTDVWNSKLSTAMGKYLSILLLLTLTFQGYAQTGEYRDILESKLKSSPEEYYTRLLEFQNANPQWPNVYYKLGNAEVERFASLDPLVDRTASDQFIYNAKTNYSLAKNYVDEREASKNPDWYEMPYMDNKDSLVIKILSTVDLKYQKAITYTEEYEKLIRNYDDAVKNYLASRELFIEINTSAENLRELFLKTDDRLKDKVKKCGVHFDSTIYHLERYKSAYQNLPHPKKRQVNIILKRIDYFRMNGITLPNFLDDNLELWDYKYWSDNFLKLIEEEVDALKNEMSQTHTRILQDTKKMLTDKECLEINSDELRIQRLINVINKYDNQSILVDLFNYEFAKIKYSNQFAYENGCNQPTAPSDNYLSRKARIVQNLNEPYNHADSLVNALKESNHNTLTFRWFFDQYFSASGIKEFANQESDVIKDSFKYNLETLYNLRNAQQLNQAFEERELYLRNDSLMIDPTSNTATPLTITNAMRINSDYWILIGKSEDERTQVVGAQVIKNGYRTFWQEILPINMVPTEYKVLTDSSLLIAGGSSKYWMKHVNLYGSLNSKFNLAYSGTLENTYFNNLLNSYLVFQESKFDQTTQNGVYRITDITSAGKTRKSTLVKTEGKFVATFQEGGKHWIMSTVNLEDSIKINARMLDLNLEPIDESFEVVLPGSINDPLIIKNDNLSFTLIGKTNDEYLYALINYDGHVSYQGTF